jgi:hypothetical protein
MEAVRPERAKQSMIAKLIFVSPSGLWDLAFLIPVADAHRHRCGALRAEANSQQPTANSQQPTANRQQPNANRQQPTDSRQQPILAGLAALAQGRVVSLLRGWSNGLATELVKWDC